MAERVGRGHRVEARDGQAAADVRDRRRIVRRVERLLPETHRFFPLAELVEDDAETPARLDALASLVQVADQCVECVARPFAVAGLEQRSCRGDHAACPGRVVVVRGQPCGGFEKLRADGARTALARGACRLFERICSCGIRLIRGERKVPRALLERQVEGRQPFVDPPPRLGRGAAVHGRPEQRMREEEIFPTDVEDSSGDRGREVVVERLAHHLLERAPSRRRESGGREERVHGRLRQRVDPFLHDLAQRPR